MKRMRLLLPACAAAVTFLAANALATVEMSKKEKKPCTTCHEKGKPTKENPLLNAIGKHYKEKGTLEGAPKK
jgi:cytochrome c553